MYNYFTYKESLFKMNTDIKVGDLIYSCFSDHQLSLRLRYVISISDKYYSIIILNSKHIGKLLFIDKNDIYVCYSSIDNLKKLGNV